MFILEGLNACQPVKLMRGKRQGVAATSAQRLQEDDQLICFKKSQAESVYPK